MIRLEEEKELLNEIKEAKNKAWEKEKKRIVSRVEVRTSTGETYVGYFTSPTRKQVKNLQKEYKDDVFSYAENIARQNLVFPDRETFEDVCEYTYGVVVNAGSELLKAAGFDTHQDLKNENSPS